MSLPRVFLVVCSLLFAAIGVAAFLKSIKQADNGTHVQVQRRAKVQEVDLRALQKPDVVPSSPVVKPVVAKPQAAIVTEIVPENHFPRQSAASVNSDTDNIQELFIPGTTCPIVETIRYSSRVAWKPKRAAWLIDYANHYKTSVDFVLRSLNGGKSAKERPVSEGENFCVFRSDRSFYFLLVVGLEDCQLKLYYVLQPPNGAQDEAQSLHFLKTYQVGLGRKSNEKVSGSLTPFGIYRLGNRVAVFRPGMTGMHKGKKVELMQVFGTRWLPFEKEIAGCTEPAKGFGIHGTPWVRVDNGQLVDHQEGIGKFESDGCIRLKSADIEELYAIISTRPGIVEIVPTLALSKLLKGEVSLPSSL